MANDHRPVRGIDVISDPIELSERMAELSARRAQAAVSKRTRVVGTDQTYDLVVQPEFPAYQPHRRADEIDATIRRRLESKGCFDL